MLFSLWSLGINEPSTTYENEITQSQKTQGFCVADFATLSDERRSCSKIFLLFNMVKEPCVRKFEGLARSKLLGISQIKQEIILASSI